MWASELIYVFKLRLTGLCIIHLFCLKESVTRLNYPKYPNTIFSFTSRQSYKKLNFPYAPNLSNWTIVKTKIEATTSLSWLHAQSSIDALFNFLDMQLWWYQIIKGIKNIYSISKPEFNKNTSIFSLMLFRIWSLTLGILGRSVYNARNLKYLSTWKLFTLLFLSLQKFVIGATYYKKVYNELAYQNKKNVTCIYFTSIACHFRLVR